MSSWKKNVKNKENLKSMNNKEKEELLYLKAQQSVNQLRWFYVHFVGYLVVVGLVIWNLIIIENTAYTDAILAINYSTIFIWGFFLVLHAIRVFKKRTFFNKEWEEKKIKEFMGNKHNTWE